MHVSRPRGEAVKRRGRDACMGLLAQAGLWTS